MNRIIHWKEKRAATKGDLLKEVCRSPPNVMYSYAIKGGHDHATFYGSDNNDTLKIDNGGTRIYGGGYYNYTTGFDFIEAHLQGLGSQDKVWLDGVNRSKFEGAVDHFDKNDSHFEINKA